MWDIAQILSVTPATIIYWMKKHNLQRRSSSECAYVKQNPNGDPFRIKNKLTDKDKELLLLGIPKHFIAVNIHSDSRSKPDKQWSQYGIARIEVRNVKLKRWIDKELEQQIGKWN